MLPSSQMLPPNIQENVIIQPDHNVKYNGKVITQQDDNIAIIQLDEYQCYDLAR
jgi:hypothetical protein